LKIVSLLPSATEIVFALGLGDDLEGVTYECDFPPEARKKPIVSDTALPQAGTLTPGQIDALVRDFMHRREPLYVLNKELIREIQPDLILAQDLCRVCAVPSGQVEDALGELGCTSEVLSLDPHSLGDVLDCIVQVGRSTGRGSRARELVDGLEARVESVRRIAARLPAVRTLALEWNDPPWVGGHWIPEMVAIAGGFNVLNEPGQPSRRVTWHEIRDAAPEIVVFMPCGMYLPEAEAEGAQVVRTPEVAETPAGRAGSVFAVDASSHFSRPGPRLVDGLEILAWAVHPDVFPQPSADAVGRVGVGDSG
jgi:iron complex transport system substrate-binding protein